MKRTPVVFAVLILCFHLSAREFKGDRILAWQVDMTENGEYDSAFAFARTACMESIHQFFKWSSLDTNGGRFDHGFIERTLDIANIYYPAYGIKAELQIAPVNTNILEVPGDLRELSFGDPVMIQRFRQTLDTLFAHIPDLELSALNIGNEHNIYMESNDTLYAEYKVFLDSVVPYAKKLYRELHGTELRVGTTFTLMDMIKPEQAPLCKYVNDGLDIISTTYYPQNDEDFSPTLEKIDAHLDTLISHYKDTDQDIYFVECGFATTPLVGGSPELQAAFFSNMFTSWDRHMDRLKYLTVFKSTDWSHGEVEGLGGYYGVLDTVFAEFLRTLGVRTWSGEGENKPAYTTILCELADRNWCDVSCPTVSRSRHDCARPPKSAGASNGVELGYREKPFYTIMGRTSKATGRGSSNGVAGCGGSETTPGVYLNCRRERVVHIP